MKPNKQDDDNNEMEQNTKIDFLPTFIIIVSILLTVGGGLAFGKYVFGNENIPNSGCNTVCRAPPK
jgi:hypothetical protein